MDMNKLRKTMDSITQTMLENRDYLVDLDARSGDGDLGISMSVGFSAVYKCLVDTKETDLGRVLMKCSSAFNEAAPSTMGTIISFGIMGMAKSLKGKTDATLEELVAAMEAGLNLIMEKAKSKPGEKTILDSLYPALNALKEALNLNDKEAFYLAYEAAKEGMESTKFMKSIHGRAAYYGERTIGFIDAGSVVGKLIFEGLAKGCNAL